MFIGVPSDGWAEGIGLLAVYTLLDSLTMFTYLILLNSEGMGGFNVSTLSSLVKKLFLPKPTKSLNVPYLCLTRLPSSHSTHHHAVVFGFKRRSC